MIARDIRTILARQRIRVSVREVVCAVLASAIVGGLVVLATWVVGS